MVPCPWFFEFAEYAKEHQDLDIGVHITLTAEWNDYKWDGVLASSEIPSLLTEEGYFYASVEEVAKNADHSGCWMLDIMLIHKSHDFQIFCTFSIRYIIKGFAFIITG